MSFSDALNKQLQQQIQQLELPETFMQTLQQILLPLAQYIQHQASLHDHSSLISINGSQGSGKSTMTLFLQLILQQHFKLNTVAVSIDDFYLTRAQRQQLAQQVHPLLATRGVPGTHDLQLALDTMHCLQHCSEQTPCKIPLFDKSIDDRAEPSRWPLVQQPVDVILFEGWCNHAPPASEQALLTPVNELEKCEDSDGVWRRYVNQQLQEYHQQLFDQADSLIFLQIPSFEKVYEWRGLQEHKLKKTASESSQGVMDEQQLRRFIQHYERITRACLDGLPHQADVVLKIDDAHRMVSLHFNEQRNDV